jgi:O-antigen/teichoic acid export membrane protein
MIKRYLRSPTVVSTGIHGLGLAVRLLFVMVLVREGSPAVLGYFGLLTAIEMVAIYAAGFELHTFSTRRYAQRPSPSRLRICFAAHTRTFRFSMPLAALIAVSSAWLLDVELDTLGFTCFAVIAATGTVAQETNRYLVILAKPIRAIVMTFLRSAGWMPFVMPFIGAEQHTVRIILTGWLAASVLSTLWGLHAVREALSRRLRIRARYVIHALGRSFNYYFVATLGVVQANVERFVLQIMLGPTAVGIYSLFLTLANTLTALLQTGVLNIFLPRLLLGFGSLLPERAATLSLAVKRALMVCVLMSIVIMVLSVPIVHLTNHASYMEYLWILPVLLVAQSLLMTSQPVHLALYGAHHDRLLLGITVAALVSALLVSVALIQLAGITGAAVAPLLVSAAVAYARWTAYRRLAARGLA